MFWVTTILIVVLIIYAYRSNYGTNLLEFIFSVFLIGILWARAYYVDKILRQKRAEEIISFNVFMTETSLTKFISLAITLRPYYKLENNLSIEATRRTTNLLTYISYSLIFILIVFNFL